LSHSCHDITTQPRYRLR